MVLSVAADVNEIAHLGKDFPWAKPSGCPRCGQPLWWHGVELDNWIRRRVRMCYWKQWRKPRTKVRKLLQLGVPLRAAISCGISSKSYWRSSKTAGINMGLGNKYLQQQGLFALRDGWIAFHHG